MCERSFVRSFVRSTSTSTSSRGKRSFSRRTNRCDRPLATWSSRRICILGRGWWGRRNASRIYAFERTFSVKPLISYISKSDQSFILSLFYFPSAEAVTLCVCRDVDVRSDRAVAIQSSDCHRFPVYFFLGTCPRQPCRCMHLLTGRTEEPRSRPGIQQWQSRDGLPFPSFLRNAWVGLPRTTTVATVATMTTTTVSTGQKFARKKAYHHLRSSAPPRSGCTFLPFIFELKPTNAICSSGTGVNRNKTRE